MDVDGGEGTSAGIVGSGGGFSESTGVHIVSEESAMDDNVFNVGLPVCKPPDETSALSDTQKFQLLLNHFKPDRGSKVPLAYLEVKKDH